MRRANMCIGCCAMVALASGCVREPGAGESDDLRTRADSGSTDLEILTADLGGGPDLEVPAADLADAPDLETGLAGCDQSDSDVPDELRCTGRCASWTQLITAAGVEPYAPGFQLWSDGAKKARWVRLPPGTHIDVSDANEWRFPVGTKLW